MKPLILSRKKILPLLLLANLATASLAVAGGDHSGGGNTINHELIEDYAVDYADLKGHDAFESKLAELREISPALADRIKAKLEQTTFYVIPREIAELPAEKTGLHFKSEQDALQEGREVFINAVGNDARTEDKAGEMIMHEALMMSQETKDARTVRQVLVKLYAKNKDVKAIQNALVINNFGTSLTKDQKKIVEFQARNDYLVQVATVTKITGESCRDPKVNLQSLRNVLATGWPDKNDRGAGEIRDPYRKTYVSDTQGYFSPFLQTAFLSSIGWMHTLDVSSGASPLFSACVRNPSYFAKEVCEEVRKHYTEGAPDFGREQETRLQAWYQITNERENGATKGVVEAFSRLMQHPSFLNLMAINMDPKTVHEWTHREDMPVNERMLKILRKVEDRQRTLDRGDARATRRLLCGSVESLNRDLMDTLRDVEADEKAGKFGARWEIGRPSRYDEDRRDDDRRPSRKGEGWVDPAI